MPDAVRVDRGPVTIVTIDRQDAANALDRTTLRALREAFWSIEGDNAVRAVVVTGAGDKAFCAGADLKERASMSTDEVREYIATIRDAITSVERLPQPVVAAVNGGAFGGGCELALACDIRMMADTAWMGLTETGLGIIPGGGGTQRLPRIVRRARAL